MNRFPLICLLVLTYIVGTQQQGFKIPPGSRVEVEIEIEPPPPGPMVAGSMPMSPMMSMMPPQSPMAAMMAPQGGAIQQLLNNMLRVALNVRRMTGNRSPLPMMEEPCPCDVECCAMPMEPRRIIPVMSIPMTLHRGCCGCVECPTSLSTAVSSLIQFARMVRPTGPATGAGGDAR